jgi:hypothetical protein
VIQNINSYSGVAAFGPAVAELPPTNSVPPVLRGGTFSNRYAELDVDDEVTDPFIADPTVEPAESSPADSTINPRTSEVDSAAGVVSQPETRYDTVTTSELHQGSEQGMVFPNPPNIDAAHGPDDDVPDQNQTYDQEHHRQGREQRRYLAGWGTPSPCSEP